MELNKLKANWDLLEEQLVEARKNTVRLKAPVDEAFAAREAAGFPRGADHPLLQAHSKAIRDYEQAYQVANEIYAQCAKARGAFMEQRAKEFGSSDARIVEARVSAPSDAEAISRHETERLAAIAEGRKPKPTVNENVRIPETPAV
jgi:hypothetical protein